MEAPLVSIIVPVYNTAAYVETCIQSVFAQSYLPIELVLVNDGSTDGSGEVCQKYAALPNVHYVEQENLGATAARKRGVEEAHGDWIMFVDSDDTIPKEAVNCFLAASDGVDLVVGRIFDTVAAYPPLITREDYLLMMYTKRISSSPCAKLIKRSLFNEKTLCFHRDVCRWEDWLMNLQIATDNQKAVKTISASVYHYRTRSDSSSHTYLLSYRELKHLCRLADEIVADELAASPDFKKAKRENRRKLFRYELLMYAHHLWRFVRPVVRPVGAVAVVMVFYLLRLCPIQKNKVIASVSAGRRYDDNQKYIMDELHQLRPDVDIVWVKDPKYDYKVPDWMRTVKWRSWRWLYEYATAKIWTNNSMEPDFFVKRKGQLYVETWHGGLGIKKVADDMIGDAAKAGKETLYLKNASDMADVYISNSDHLSTIYRRAFHYHGPIWKCGYPKNDMLVNGHPECGQQARQELGIPADVKVLLYAPTIRQRFTEERQIDMKVYDMDMPRLKTVLTETYGGEWTMLIRFHPSLRLYAKGYQETHPEVMDVTDYQDMQRLLMAADVVISDYSSCIFDAALRRIPCFTYATDFEQYKNEEHGVYYEMEELPFPYATNNDELEQNVKTFNLEAYLQKWDAFAVRMGLNETGHAAKDIAEKMADFLNGKAVNWPNDYK